MKKSIFGILALLAASGACLAQSEQPSLGDVAKQSRTEKKTVKVFTNEDVATTRPPSATEQGAPKTASPAGAASSASAANDTKSDKSDKKKENAASASKDTPEVAELKQKISSYKEELDGWKRSAKKYQDLLSTETSDFRRQMYQDALQGDQNNIQQFQTKLDEAQAALAKTEKAGH